MVNEGWKWWVKHTLPTTAPRSWAKFPVEQTANSRKMPANILREMFPNIFLKNRYFSGFVVLPRLLGNCRVYGNGVAGIHRRYINCCGAICLLLPSFKSKLSCLCWRFDSGENKVFRICRAKTKKRWWMHD